MESKKQYEKLSFTGKNKRLNLRHPKRYIFHNCNTTSYRGLFFCEFFVNNNTFFFLIPQMFIPPTSPLSQILRYTWKFSVSTLFTSYKVCFTVTNAAECCARSSSDFQVYDATHWAICSLNVHSCCCGLFVRTCVR